MSLVEINRTVSLRVGGHDLSRLLSEIKITAEPFRVEVDASYLDEKGSQFNPHKIPNRIVFVGEPL